MNAENAQENADYEWNSMVFRTMHHELGLKETAMKFVVKKKKRYNQT